MRIGIAALHHETNSFSNIPMDWEYLLKTRFGKETYRDIYAPRRNYSDGFIVSGRELGIEIVLTASAYLCPSGHITDEALEKYRDGLVAGASGKAIGCYCFESTWCRRGRQLPRCRRRDPSGSAGKVRPGQFPMNNMN